MFSENAKNKAVRKNSTSNLKSKKPSGQSAIKAFLDKGLPGKNGKLDMNISAVANKYAAARSFTSSSVVVLSSFFLWKIWKCWKISF